MRFSFPSAQLSLFKSRALHWAAQQRPCCFLDSNRYQSQLGRHEALLAVGAKRVLSVNEDAFAAWEAFCQEKQSWLFGYLTYDLKNELEALASANSDELHWPSLHFFEPEVLLRFEQDAMEVLVGENPAAIVESIQNHTPIPEWQPPVLPPLQQRLSKTYYLETVQRIRAHIEAGDVYEMNFCQEFFIEKAKIAPLPFFWALNRRAAAPFSAFYALEDHYLCCASPERYLQKRGQQIIAQPIKGTSRRGRTSEEDEQLKKQLYHSIKDRSENVMIVDLMRNDFARSCKPGTVEVPELFGIYGFEQVYQMISTVQGELRDDLHFTDAIRQAFPMGSMTGAPKIMSMRLIEQYEASKRGLYSGSVGYIQPNGDFDFNVVIRSVLYEAQKQYLSFQVGGAIVYDSEPEAEYAECLLKAKAILETLGLG